MPDHRALAQIGKAFGKDQDFFPVGKGHINDTYRSGDGLWILQRINTNIFRKPREVMENIVSTQAYLRERILREGGDAARGAVTVIPTVDGALFYEDESGCWRMYENIRGTHSLEPEERTLAEFKKAGEAFGRFQRRLSGFHAELLHITIPDFHNTPARLRRFKEVLSGLQDKDPAADRLRKARPLADFILAHEALAPVIVNGIEDGSIPLAVTHNDTKINNVLFDDISGEAVAVVDLDTIMPGSRLYDFGDGIRSGAVTAAEDEPDLSKVHFDPEAYREFREGYLSEAGDMLTKTEKELLLTSAELMTYECGIRFLTDYLENDVYYKTEYPEHNLIRARNQFRILDEMIMRERSAGLPAG